MALSIPLAALATTAQGAAAATLKPLRPAVAGSCAFDIGNLAQNYMYPDARTNLDVWAVDGDALSDEGKPAELESPSSSSNLDCFQVQGGFGNGEVGIKLAQSSLCFNIAGDSHSAGAWVIMYNCTYPSNELFYEVGSGLGNATGVFRSVSSGLCIDLSGGFNAGSILEQKACSSDDPWQSWFINETVPS
jgi:hypothetical protein